MVVIFIILIILDVIEIENRLGVCIVSWVLCWGIGMLVWWLSKSVWVTAITIGGVATPVGVLEWDCVRDGCQSGEKRAENRPQKRGLGDRQVGAFSVFRLRDTGIPFIFSRFLLFFHKFDRFRGWCNTTPSSVLFCDKNGAATGWVLFGACAGIQFTCDL